MLGSTNNYTSTDGVNWAPIPVPFIDPSPHLIFCNGLFMDFSGTTTRFATSTNGIDWQAQDLGLIDYSGTGKIFPGIGVTGAVYGNGKYVVAATYYPNAQAGGSPYPIVITSPDGVKWTMTKLDGSCRLESIAFGNGIFVATGVDGGILTSSDGLNWTRQSTGVTASYGEVSFCNGKFIALGNGGTISISPDGVNWTINRSSYRSVFTVGQANYLLNGQTCPADAAPFVDDGHVFVPVRYLGEALGVTVGWSGNPGDQTVPLTAYVSPTTSFGVTLTIGSKTLAYQGSGIQSGSLAMEVAPLIRDGHTYLPAKYVAEAFGFTAAWDPADRTVTLEPENTPGQTLLSTLPALVQSLSIADDSPSSGWWIPQDQQDQNNVISQTLTWLKTATPYTEQIPQSAKVYLYGYLGPSRLCLTTSNNQNISIYPAYYYTAEPTVYDVEVNGVQQEQPSYLYQVQYVQGVVACDNGQGISYFKSGPLFDWLKTDQWKTEFKLDITDNG